MQYENAEYLSVASNGMYTDLNTQDDQRDCSDGYSSNLSTPGVSYNIMVEANQHLSVTTDGTKVDLYDRDDGSGRQCSGGWSSRKFYIYATHSRHSNFYE